MKNPFRSFPLTCLIPSICMIASFSILPGQNLFQQKDLAFAQVAGGPGFETVLTLTNRGSWEYAGLLQFRKGTGELWNPVVNGTRITGGEVTVSLAPDQVAVFRVTEDELMGGFAMLVSDDLIPDNFVEGNLTYYLQSDQTLVDSVGIAPSTEFYLASLPFDDFGKVALALANPDLSGQADTKVRIRLLDDQGLKQRTAYRTLVSQGHFAEYLFEIFGNIQLTRGKIEIASALPIVGTALTSTQGQLSSLPLASAPVGYSVRMEADGGGVFEGQMGLWVEGFFVRGYLVIQRYNSNPIAEPQVTLVSGQLIDGFLDLSFFATGEAYFNEEATLYLADADYSILDLDSQGAWVMLFLSDLGTLEGSFTLNRTTP